MLKEIILSHHGVQLDKIFYKELSDVISEVAKFLLGKKFSTMGNVAHVESVSILLRLCQNSIEEGLTAVQRVQNSYLPQYLLQLWERLPRSVSDFFLPADCKPEYVKFLARAVGANLVRELIGHLGTITGIQPEQAIGASLVEYHVPALSSPVRMSLATIHETAVQSGDAFKRSSISQNNVASSEEKKSETEAQSQKGLAISENDHFSSAVPQVPNSQVTRRNRSHQPSASPRMGMFARTASGVFQAAYQNLSNSDGGKRRVATSFTRNSTE